MQQLDVIIKYAKILAANVKKEKSYFDETVYKLNVSQLDQDLQIFFKEFKEKWREMVSSEMRFTDSPKAIEGCRDVTTFAKELLESNISDKLKIALFYEFNIAGYMFDRNRVSYVACYQFLAKLLDEVECYKSKLTMENLKIWNDSTYGGEAQIPFFRGVLEGITIR